MLVKSWMSRPAITIDARVLLRIPDKPSPLLLVISPYPDQYEEHATTNAGVRAQIRF